MELVYNLKIKIESLKDGDYRYMATSPDLPNLIVAGDTVDEVLAEVPVVARALIETMRETGQPLPDALRLEPMPYQANLPVVV
jgi:predicted RNase H-like HicB family nuclease